MKDTEVSELHNNQEFIISSQLNSLFCLNYAINSTYVMNLSQRTINFPIETLKLTDPHIRRTPLLDNHPLKSFPLVPQLLQLLRQPIHLLKLLLYDLLVPSQQHLSFLLVSLNPFTKTFLNYDILTYS